jgi:hypothetical protein
VFRMQCGVGLWFELSRGEMKRLVADALRSQANDWTMAPRPYRHSDLGCDGGTCNDGLADNLGGFPLASVPMRMNAAVLMQLGNCSTNRSRRV